MRLPSLASRILSLMLLLGVMNIDLGFAEMHTKKSRSAFLPRESQSIQAMKSIPRGGAIPAVSINPKTVATAALSCLGVHCALDIVSPKTSIECYGLDKYEAINAFYFSRIGGWGLTTVVSLLLQLYAEVPFVKTLGYAFLPITALTMFQLLAGKYEEAGVNPNSGIMAIIFHDMHFLVCFLATKLPSMVVKFWLPFYLALVGLSGLNLIISAQTIPGLSPSAVTILRMLGTVSCYITTTFLSQDCLGFDPSKAVGVLLATLAVTSIPVCFDLKRAARKSSRSDQMYMLFVALELMAAFYLLR